MTVNVQHVLDKVKFFSVEYVRNIYFFSTSWSIFNNISVHHITIIHDCSIRGSPSEYGFSRVGFQPLGFFKNSVVLHEKQIENETGLHDIFYGILELA